MDLINKNANLVTIRTIQKHICIHKNNVGNYYCLEVEKFGLII